MGLEAKPQRVIPRPEDVLSPKEADLIGRAERGEVVCLRCGAGLSAVKVVSPGYAGVVLFCPVGACGFVEY